MTTSALATIDSQPPTLPAGVELGTLRAASPAEFVAGAAAIAKVLADVIERQQLYVTLSGRKYVRVEGWTTCAALIGLTPYEEHVEQHERVYVATVQLRRLADGHPVSRASAECGADDEVDRNGKPMWANRPAYARRSMAITRATGKACRLPLSWIMTMSGYEATPAEEMEPHEDASPRVLSSPPPAVVRPSAPPGTSDASFISVPQQKRFFALAKQHAWPDDALKALLHREGLARSSQIPRSLYDALCHALEQGPSDVVLPDEPSF